MKLNEREKNKLHQIEALSSSLLVGGAAFPSSLLWGGAFSSILWVLMPFPNIVLRNEIQLQQFD